MKRTLALLLVAASAAVAQTPTVVEKPAVKATAKPAPTTLKVVAVPVTKPVVVAAKPSATATPAKAPAAARSVATPAARAVSVSAKPAAPAAHVAVVSAKPATVVNAPKVMVAPVKADPFKSSKAHPALPKLSGKAVAVAAKSSSPAPAAVAVQDNKPAADNKAAKSINTAGKRDPFVSPVVTMGAIGSGCSSGKRCLAIDQVNLRGVVKSDSGMIAVVVNSADKAYFLHENDPVFDGYVVKITGDSIVFKETFHDKLGKPLTRDVTKTISRPAV